MRAEPPGPPWWLLVVAALVLVALAVAMGQVTCGILESLRQG